MNPSFVLRSERFSTAPEGDLDRCNGQPGSALAAWVRAQLTAAGFACGDPIQEDYGWGTWVERDGWTVWIAVSFAGDPGDPPAEGEWFVTPAFETPFLLFRPGRWFRRAAGRALETAVRDALRAAFAGAAAAGLTLLREE